MRSLDWCKKFKKIINENILFVDSIKRHKCQKFHMLTTSIINSPKTRAKTDNNFTSSVIKLNKPTKLINSVCDRVV